MTALRSIAHPREHAPSGKVARTAGTIGVGAVGGVIGAMAMGLFTMFWDALIKDTGFWTPMYHIAATFTGPGAMMTSMHQAMADHYYWFTAGPALLGLSIHMLVGATFGIVFAFLARTLRLYGFRAIPAGAVYGLLVMVFMTYVGLHWLADAVNAGAPVRNMAIVQGAAPFALEHLVYGVMLGAVTALTLGSAARGTTPSVGEVEHPRQRAA